MIVSTESCAILGGFIAIGIDVYVSHSKLSYPAREMTNSFFGSFFHFVSCGISKSPIAHRKNKGCRVYRVLTFRTLLYRAEPSKFLTFILLPFQFTHFLLMYSILRLNKHDSICIAINFKMACFRIKRVDRPPVQ